MVMAGYMVGIGRGIVYEKYGEGNSAKGYLRIESPLEVVTSW